MLMAEILAVVVVVCWCNCYVGCWLMCVVVVVIIDGGGCLLFGGCVFVCLFGVVVCGCLMMCVGVSFGDVYCAGALCVLWFVL